MNGRVGTGVLGKRMVTHFDYRRFTALEKQSDMRGSKESKDENLFSGLIRWAFNSSVYAKALLGKTRKILGHI